ncbi:MAG TPA: DUF2231 domain-containing protein [Burkholderiales bacterium]|jgi:uncharacterized membrane protein
MRTPASIARHPIHPMLVPIPIGLWIFSLVCDLIHAGGSANPAWTTVAFYCMGGGIIGALLAAVPGLIDLVSLPAGPRGTALKHMAINLVVVALYAINFWMRLSEPGNPGKLVWLSLVSVGLLAISGWLGGKMVFEHGIAVDTPPDQQRR